MQLTDLPLTDLRATALAALVAGDDIRWAGPATTRWVVSRGYATFEPDAFAYAITDLGRAAHALDSGHRLTTSRVTLGGRPVGRGNYYGVKARCGCGWADKTNEGGREGQRRMRTAHAAHLAEVAAQAVAEPTGADA